MDKQRLIQIQVDLTIQKNQLEGALLLISQLLEEVEKEEVDEKSPQEQEPQPSA